MVACHPNTSLAVTRNLGAVGHKPPNLAVKPDLTSPRPLVVHMHCARDAAICVCLDEGAGKQMCFQQRHCTYGGKQLASAPQ